MALLSTIRFSLFKITTTEFAIIADVYKSGEPASVKTNLTFSFSEDQFLMGIHAKFTFSHDEKVFLVAAVGCVFQIMEDDWNQMFDKGEQQLTVAKVPAMHLAGLTVSTARGVIHAKTEHMPLNAVMLPPINLQEFITEDIVMKNEITQA